MPSILAERLADRVDAVVGVDTHIDTHTAAILTPVGTVLAELTVPTTPDGAEAREHLAFTMFPEDLRLRLREKERAAARRVRSA